ncbi:MAG: cytochrome c-type biogenesis CcmF C-terminal domain-containing protein [Actinomycetota bacterium]|nr:cytochrome c-type biogenesis CcmF C-terminal domain-containing protein [Actinomycetota bacterium]
MVAAAGYLSILVALISSAALVVEAIRRSRTSDPDPARLRIPVFGLAIGGVAAFLLLEIAILAHDFSIAYVAKNTALGTPFVFLLAAAWAALEGSVVLWGLMLAVFTWLVWRTVKRGDGLGVLALAVMGAVSVFWFGLMATAANPFALCTEVANGFCAATSSLPIGDAVAPADGVGPNPLLANHILMAVHPPLLYVGYVGFTVPFAFAISALIRSERSTAWLDRTHRWSLIAWVFLTAGILLGAWWSYEVLGWGGYWAWDPVENAALLPWAAATAFIHSAIVQRRRSMLQAWNYVLVITTFALTIFGTFLTRSGVISSVHAFSLSVVGPVLLIFLGLIVFGSFGLFAVRASTVSSSPRLDSLVSREGFILLNSLLMTLFGFTIMFGTMYPLLVEAFTGREVSVGRPFFDRVAVPIAFLLLAAIGVGSTAPWRVATGKVLWQRTRVGLSVGSVVAALAVLAGIGSVSVVAIMGLAGFVIGNIVAFYLHQTARAHGGGKSWPSALVSTVRNDMGFWGGQVAHVGLAFVAVAIATTSVLAIRTEVPLTVGQTAVVDAYCIGYIEPFTRAEPERNVQGARVAILDRSCSDTRVVLEPRLHEYPKFGQVIATPQVWTTWIDDVYLTIAAMDDNGIRLKVMIFPLQWLLWVGGLTIVAGGVLALGRRSRKPSQTSRPRDEQERADV